MEKNCIYHNKHTDSQIARMLFLLQTQQGHYCCSGKSLQYRRLCRKLQWSLRWWQQSWEGCCNVFLLVWASGVLPSPKSRLITTCLCKWLRILHNISCPPSEILFRLSTLFSLCYVIPFSRSKQSRVLLQPLMPPLSKGFWLSAQIWRSYSRERKETQKPCNYSTCSTLLGST